MNEREFCYWLQGLFEVGGVKSLDETQTRIVKDHLALVFKKVTPERALADSYRIYRDGGIPLPGIDPKQPYRVTCATDASDKPKNLVATC